MLAWHLTSCSWVLSSIFRNKATTRHDQRCKKTGLLPQIDKPEANFFGNRFGHESKSRFEIGLQSSLLKPINTKVKRDNSVSNWSTRIGKTPFQIKLVWEKTIIDHFRLNPNRFRPHLQLLWGFGLRNQVIVHR